MHDLERLLEALRTLYTSVEALQQLDSLDLLLPGKPEQYHTLLDAAYTALELVGQRYDALGQELEAQRDRLDAALEHFGL